MWCPEHQAPQHTPQHASQDLVRERQVLIDKDPQEGSNQLNTLNKWELVAKENEASQHGGEIRPGIRQGEGCWDERLCNGLDVMIHS